MEMVFIAAIIVIVIALVFDFTNGFHDSANQVATVIASGSISPKKALILAAGGDFVGAYFLGTAVAQTIGKGIVDPRVIDSGLSGVTVIFAALVGAIVWNMITWYIGLPSSSSHALIGGLIGAFVVSWGLEPINWNGLGIIILVMVLSPIIGFVLSFIFTSATFEVTKSFSPRVNNIFKKLQFISLIGQSLAHGTNDAQKTMGVITFVLVISGIYITPESGHMPIPGWVILASAAAMTFGILLGGWRIIKTLGMGLYRVRPIHSFSAQTVSASTIYLAAFFGFPISTTQVISSSVMGAGAATRVNMVRWLVARDMIAAWLVTVPVSAIIAAITAFAIKIIF